MFQPVPVAEAVQPAAPQPASFVERMIAATVQIDQPIDGATRQAATAFLVDAPRPDGSPRTVLVTAAHVLERMPGPVARVAWRFRAAPGRWTRELRPVTIRVQTPAGGQVAAWVRSPEQDVAVMEIAAPPEFARAAVPLAWLADETTPARLRLTAGDEMLTLGYPGGLSANSAGFPILRTGRVASFPLTPVREFPLFLLDFRVFPGNSGGPVFVTDRTDAALPSARPPVLTGVLVRQTEQDGQTFELGVVAHATYVRQAIALLDRQPAARRGPR